MLRISPIVFFACLLVLPLAAEPNTRGKAIYQKQCMNCHGEDGQGVADEYDEPLAGNRPFEKLVHYIHRTMPEDEAELCVDEDAKLVTQYIWDEFYSPDAQARLKPPRIDLTRLTVEQYRNSVADIAARFQPGSNRPFGEKRGIRGNYNSANRYRADNKKKQGPKFDRTDAAINFDWKDGSPAPDKFDAETFSIEWNGSIIAEETGLYEFVLRTRNGTLLYLNQGNDDERAFIDGWVNDGDEIKERRNTIYLLGGRAYPVFLKFFKYQQKLATVQLLWKPPGGSLQPVPGRNYLPERRPTVLTVSTPFPADDASAGYVRGSLVSQEWNEAVAKAGLEASAKIMRNINRFSGSNADSKDRKAKLKDFCRKFAVAAFRRPLSGPQYERYIERQFAEAGVKPEEAARRSILLTLTSPYFLYPALAQKHEDQFSAAASLALALWDSVPDENLFKAAAEGRLATQNQIRNQARRMTGYPQARAKLRGFFHHWLEIDAAGEIAKDRKIFPEFDDAIATDLKTSLEIFIEETVWEGNSDYRQLLLSDKVWLNKQLAKLYGKETNGSEFIPVSFGANQRSGVLTHPYLLASLSYHNNTSPIHRGVFLTRNIVGEKLNPPPAATAFKDGDFDPTLTMREKVTDLTRDKACMSCHSTINPLGFSLEHYDAIGRWRTKEKNKPIDATSDFETGEGRKLKLTGARDVANYAARNPFAHKTFVRQLFHHTVKHSPAAYGTETLEKLREKFAKSGFNIRETLAEIAVISAEHVMKPADS